MKRYALALLGPLVAATAFARVISEFRGWNELIDRSPDIVIATCTSTVGTSRSEKPVAITDGWIPSEIEVLSVLKGNTKIGSAHMMSTYWPYAGEKFVLFGTYESNPYFSGYNAGEEYQVVPLNRSFQTNMLGGQTLEEKINWVLKSRLWDLNEKLAKGNEEKKRLEEGLKTPANTATNPPPAVSKAAP